MNSMQMPQQPQPMQSAGLGAMLQARGSAGAGATKDSMNELMAMARGLPDSELADVLAGKSVRVPQFAAMLEAMGRKSLRNAVQGAQAGAMKQPNKKEQMLAELQGGQAAGLAAVPAPNMEQMGEGMADGGIVAFNGANGSAVDLERIPTNELTEEQFDALPESERRWRAFRSNPYNFTGMGTFLKGLPAAGAAYIGATAATPFLAGARAVLPESVTSKMPTVGDLFGDKGAAGVFKHYLNRSDQEVDADRQAELRKKIRARNAIGGPEYEPVPESAYGRAAADLMTDIKGAERDRKVREQLMREYARRSSGFAPGTDAERAAARNLYDTALRSSGPDLRALAAQSGQPAVSVVPPGVAPRAEAEAVYGGEAPTRDVPSFNEPGTASATSTAAPATVAPSAPGGAGPARTNAVAPKAGLDALTAGRGEAPAGRKSPIDELIAPTDEIAKQLASGKEQAQGEFLMTLGASILSRPNLGVALGQGIKEGLPGLAAHRKEANMLLKDQRDYSLNLAKAKEAAAQGRDDLAFKYADLAERAQYHAGMIGAYMARASGAGGHFTEKQQQAAMDKAQREVDGYISKLGPLEKRRMTPEIRDQMLMNALNRNLQVYRTGVMSPMPDPRVVNELPQGGNVLSRD